MLVSGARTSSGGVDQIFRDSRTPWAIDMDGTLIDEDVTEMAIKKSVANPLYWPVLFVGLLLLAIRGPARFFRFMENRMPLAGKHLSYNGQLTALVNAHRERGGKAVLATAAHVSTGEIVVRDGGLSFDDIWGSCMKRGPANVLDMAAERKANVLDQHLCSIGNNKNGKKGFVYAGNSKDDLKVWSHPSCKGMILVNCKEKVLQQAINIPKPRLIIPGR